MLLSAMLSARQAPTAATPRQWRASVARCACQGRRRAASGASTAKLSAMWQEVRISGKRKPHTPRLQRLSRFSDALRLQKHASGGAGERAGFSMAGSERLGHTWRSSSHGTPHRTHLRYAATSAAKPAKPVPPSGRRAVPAAAPPAGGAHPMAAAGAAALEAPQRSCLAAPHVREVAGLAQVGGLSLSTARGCLAGASLLPRTSVVDPSAQRWLTSRFTAMLGDGGLEAAQEARARRWFVHQSLGWMLHATAGPVRQAATHTAWGCFPRPAQQLRFMQRTVQNARASTTLLQHRQQPASAAPLRSAPGGGVGALHAVSLHRQ